MSGSSARTGASWWLVLGMGCLNLVLLGALLGAVLVGGDSRLSDHGRGHRHHSVASASPEDVRAVRRALGGRLHRIHREFEHYRELRGEVMELAATGAWGAPQRARMGELLARARGHRGRDHARVHEALLEAADELAEAGRTDLLPTLFDFTVRGPGGHKGHGGHKDHKGHGERR